VILYISGGGGLLERMAACNPDCISIDQSVDIVDGIKRIGKGFAIQVCSNAVFLPFREKVSSQS
jgi:uroporphyrinogen decarboxylase